MLHKLRHIIGWLPNRHGLHASMHKPALCCIMLPLFPSQGHLGTWVWWVATPTSPCPRCLTSLPPAQTLRHRSWAGSSSSSINCQLSKLCCAQAAQRSQAACAAGVRSRAQPRRQLLHHQASQLAPLVLAQGRRQRQAAALWWSSQPRMMIWCWRRGVGRGPQTGGTQALPSSSRSRHHSSLMQSSSLARLSSLSCSSGAVPHPVTGGAPGGRSAPGWERRAAVGSLSSFCCRPTTTCTMPASAPRSPTTPEVRPTQQKLCWWRLLGRFYTSLLQLYRFGLGPAML